MFYSMQVKFKPKDSSYTKEPDLWKSYMVQAENEYQAYSRTIDAINKFGIAPKNVKPVEIVLDSSVGFDSVLLFNDNDTLVMTNEKDNYGSHIYRLPDKVDQKG